MSRANVMIVDDDRDMAESLAELLEISGCSVTTAANGKEACWVTASRISTSPSWMCACPS